MNISTVDLITEGVRDGEKKELLMNPEGYIAAAVALFITGVCGCVFNLFVIITMCRDKQLWTPLNVILFNLVCSDLAVSILGNPWTLLSAISYGWIFGSIMCMAYGFFMSLLGITSITTLAVLSFVRYRMVSRPIRNQNLSNRDSCYIIIGIWMYSLILTTPPLFGWGEYVSEAANISCSVNWEEKSFNSRTYIIYLFTFGLVVPLAIIIFSYTQILIAMKQNQLQMGKVRRVEKQVTLMILIMIIAFMVAWTPYAVLALIVQFGSWDISPSVGVIPALLAKSSIFYNPVIYVGLNTQFRQSWKQLFRRTSSRKSPRSKRKNNDSSQVTQEFTTVATKKSFIHHNKILKSAPQVSVFVADQNGEISVLLDLPKTGGSPKGNEEDNEECSQV